VITSSAVAPQELPCADAALLAPLKASTEFATIGPRLLTHLPLDTWQEDELHFFVFRLRADGVAGNEQGAERDAPVAVFVMDFASDAPISAVVVTTRPDGTEPEVHDLRIPDGTEAALNAR
jgi:hypothetical protein